MAQIICKNLVIGYDGKEVLRVPDLCINSGDYLCIVGQNGSGKTTLMKTLTGLIPPVDGNIVIGDGLRQREIGYLPQQTLIQKDFPASVTEIVMSGFQGKRGLRPFYTKAEKEQAESALTRMGIESLRKRCYRELSGGQQQRVLLARALCATQKLLLLDEPASGLDPAVTTDMYRIIEKLNSEERITVVMISHDIDAAVKYASHVLHIGSKVYYGTKDEYLKSDGRFLGGV